MKDLIKEIYTYVPIYILEYVKLLSNPKSYVAQQNAMLDSNMDGGHVVLVKALSFMGMSCCISLIFFYPATKNNIFFLDFFGILITQTVVWSVVMAGILQLSWRIVGGRAKFENYLITQSYTYGILLLLFVLFCLILFDLYGNFKIQ